MHSHGGRQATIASGKGRWLSLAFVALFLYGVGIWFGITRWTGEAEGSFAQILESRRPQASAGDSLEPDRAEQPEWLKEFLADVPPERHEMARELMRGGDDILARVGREDSRPVEDLEAIQDLLSYFQSIVKPAHGLPTGTHEEIVATLLGDNSWGIPFLSPDHPALNPQRRIVDRWQTPVFFHAEAHDQLSIRSAGPDRAMWTGDDLIFPEHPALRQRDGS